MKDYDLEEAARQYRDEFLDKNDNDISNYDIEDIFIAGANWQYEQFEKERLKHCDKLTAEQAQIESDFVVQHLEKYNRTPTFIDAIEYGRNQVVLKLESLCKEWHLHTSAEAKYRMEVYDELLEMLKEEKK